MKCPKCGKDMHLEDMSDGVWFVCDYCLIKKSPYTVYDDSDDECFDETPKSVSKKVNHSVYSIPLLISMFIGIAYILYSAAYWSSLNTSSGVSAQIGSGIATLLVLPHLVVAAIAVLFNVLGFCLKKRWLALTCAILYTVSMLLFPAYFMFVILEVVLSFVAFATMTRAKPSNAKNHSYALIACAVIGILFNLGIAYNAFSENTPSAPSVSDSKESDLQRQFEQIQNGMSYQDVVNIIGRDGVNISEDQTAGINTVMYQWTDESGFGNIIVMLQNDSVVNKTQAYTSDASDSAKITLDTYNQIQTGMSYEEVKNIIGGDGILNSDTNIADISTKIYTWYAEDGISNASIIFQNDAVTTKSQFGLE